MPSNRAKQEIPEAEIEGYGQRFFDRKAEGRKLVDEEVEDSLED